MRFVNMHTCFNDEFKLRPSVGIVSPNVHSLQTGSHAVEEEHKDQYFSVQFSKTPPEKVSLQLFHQNPALSPSSFTSPPTSYLLPSTSFLLLLLLAKTPSLPVITTSDSN